MGTTETVCPNHLQPLQLKPAGAPFTCSGCCELGFGRRYCCKNSTCNHVLHEECTDSNSFAFHDFFERSYFEFCAKPPGHRTRYCDACGKDVLGFVYHCYRTGYDLHPCCLKLKKSITDEDGNVTLKLSDKVPRKCAWCRRRNVVDGVKGWSYVSVSSSSSSSSFGGDNICYHVSCVKDLVLEKWKRGYFSQQIATSSVNGGGGGDVESHQIVTVTTSKRSSRTMKKYSKIAVVIFKLIFSAIFGNPISAFAALVEALVSD